MKITGSQIVIECLVEQGVDTVFGYPGGAILNIYDELYKNENRIRHILTAHEQGASHAVFTTELERFVFGKFLCLCLVCTKVETTTKVFVRL